MLLATSTTVLCSLYISNFVSLAEIVHVQEMEH